MLPLPSVVAVWAAPPLAWFPAAGVGPAPLAVTFRWCSIQPEGRTAGLLRFLPSTSVSIAAALAHRPQHQHAASVAAWSSIPLV